MPAVHECSARAMGTTARVLVVGANPSLAEAALHRVDDIETRWSRFRADSELSRLNAAAGAPCLVSADLFTLVDHLVGAWRRTAGRFDPAVYDAMIGLGYDRSFTTIDSPILRDLDDATPGCAGIRLQASTQMVWLPAGVHLDPGGLGKGLAADMVAREVMDAGAAGVLVDLGGDIRVMGDSPDGDAWQIGIEHPERVDVTVAMVATRDGGIATSSRRKRRWQSADGTEVHHVLDPRSAHPAGTRWASATVIAATAVEAEVGATVVLLDSDLDSAPFAFGALLIDEYGDTRHLGEHPELFALAVR